MISTETDGQKFHFHSLMLMPSSLSLSLAEFRFLNFLSVGDKSTNAKVVKIDFWNWLEAETNLRPNGTGTRKEVRNALC